MATAAKPKIPGVMITITGQWRCNNCQRSTTTTPVCAGAHDDGSPSCGKAVCASCADRCVRCHAYLCPDCYRRSKEGGLCVQCPVPAGGRAAYVQRQRARAGYTATAPSNGHDWRSEADETLKAAADAQQSVDDAMKRAAEIERSLNEMKAQMRKNQDGKRQDRAR
jgi:hypothetical protein